MALFAALSLGAASAVPLNLTLQLTDGTRPFMGRVKTSSGQSVTLESWSFYVSGVALILPDGSEVAVPLFQRDVPAGDSQGFRFT